MITPTSSSSWPVGPAGLYFLLVHGLLLPAAVVRARRKVVAGGPLPPKTRYLVSTLIQLTLIAALSVLVARLEHVPIFPAYEFQPFHLALGLGALALAVGFMWPRWKKAVESGNRVAQLFAPETRLHFALWTLVCLGAGIGEEITYRGVLTPLLARLSGDLTVAVVASAILFGIVHMVQGWKSSAVIVFFALGFQLLVLATSSLYVAMAVHVAYDLIAGAAYSRFTRAKRERDAAAMTSATGS